MVISVPPKKPTDPKSIKQVQTSIGMIKTIMLILLTCDGGVHEQLNSGAKLKTIKPGLKTDLLLKPETLPLNYMAMALKKSQMIL